MKFYSRRDCDIWCKTCNGIWLAVERATIPFEKKCGDRSDLRIQKMSKLIYRLTTEFRENLIKGIDQIKKEDADNA